MVIVADEKTPHIDVDGFLSIKDQEALGYPIDMPTNHYSRKNIGYLFAISQGADIIYDTDDDNVPYINDEWFSYSKTVELPSHCPMCLVSEDQFINVYKQFTDNNIWPRGYPLDKVLYEEKVEKIKKNCKVGVWQGMVNGDPDVDAIYRLTVGKKIIFDKGSKFVLDKHVYSPFNSQNTMWHKSAFPLMYLPVNVSFRFTDILRGYIAQRLMWEQDLYLGMSSPTAYQKRNKHDLIKDFNDEVYCYENIGDIVAELENIKLSGKIHDDLHSVYSMLDYKFNIFEDISNWTKALEQCTR